VTDGDGRTTVALQRLTDGHFAVKAQVNGADTWMIFDTGATSTVLSAEDATAAGFDVGALSFGVPIMTANGAARAAAVTVDDLAVGGIVRHDLRVFVAQPGMLGQSLLGMNFINSLAGFDMRGDRLTLID
jgi:aspartyl protease family protein